MIYERLKDILTRLNVTRYLRVKVSQEEIHTFRQRGPGRPGPDTTYRRIAKRRDTLTWEVRVDLAERDHMHDGMFPLLSNDRRC